MQTVSDLWNELISNNKWTAVPSVVINGVEYETISAPVITRNAMPSALSVGNCISATLEFSILTDDDLSDASEVQVLYKLTEDGSTYTEQIKKGTFYINARSEDYESGLITFSCYDAALKLNSSYTVEEETSMTDVVSDIAETIGVSVDSRTSINSGDDYVVTASSDLTMQQIMGYIAACHGGNWIITPDNELRLVKITTVPDDTNFITSEIWETISTADGSVLIYDETDDDATEADVAVTAILGSLTTDTAVTITCIEGTNGDDSFSGGTDGYTVTLDDNPYLAQSIIDDLCSEFVGCSYVPYTATSSILDPAAELGDRISIGSLVLGVLYAETETLNSLYQVDLSTPSCESLSEYPYISTAEKALSTASSALSTAEEALEEAEEASEAAEELSETVTTVTTEVKELEELLGFYVTSETTYGSTVLESLSSSIELTADEILSTVSASYATIEDLEDTESEITTAYTSAISQSATEILSTVSATYTTTGSNLLQDGGFESSGYWENLPSGMALDTDDPNGGTYCMACSAASGTPYIYLNHPYSAKPSEGYIAIPVEPGETYRITAYCMASSDAVWSNNNTKIRVGACDDSYTLITVLDASDVTAGGGWTKLTKTWTNTDYTEVNIRLVMSVSSGTVYWDDIRFELDTATSDDIDSVTVAYTSAISQKADEIYSTVSATYATTAYVDDSVDSATSTITTAYTSAISQKADEIYSTVSATYATTDALSEVDAAADEANETAESAYAAATAVYGTCATAASTAAKAVTCSDFTLYSGASIAVTFTYANTAGAITLNVNSTGAKSVYVSGATASTSNYMLWSAGSIIQFVYNGTYWVYAGGATSYNVTCSTAVSTAAKTASQTGAVICKGTNAIVNWTYGNSYSSGALTFNLGSTAAKNIYVGTSVTSSSNPMYMAIGETSTLTFSGAYWYTSGSYSSTSIVRQTTDGVEVAKIINGSYTTTKATITDSSFNIVSSDDEVLSSFTSDGMLVYVDGTEVASVGTTSASGSGTISSATYAAAEFAAGSGTKGAIVSHTNSGSTGSADLTVGSASSAYEEAILEAEMTGYGGASLIVEAYADDESYENNAVIAKASDGTNTYKEVLIDGNGESTLDGKLLTINHDDVEINGGVGFFSNTTLSIESGSAFHYVANEDTGSKVGFGVGSGGYNRGVYDSTFGDWIIKADEDYNVTLGEDEEVTIKGAITTANSINIIKSGSEDTGTYVITTRTDTGASLYTGVGAAGYNRGIYDATNSTWICYKDSDDEIHLGQSTVGGTKSAMYLKSGVPTAGLLVDYGTVTITPSAANTPTSATVTFSTSFTSTPHVVATPRTAYPGTYVTGVGVMDRTTTGCTIYVTRTNTTETTISWIAVGY